MLRGGPAHLVTHRFVAGDGQPGRASLARVHAFEQLGRGQTHLVSDGFIAGDGQAGRGSTLRAGVGSNSAAGQAHPRHPRHRRGRWPGRPQGWHSAGRRRRATRPRTSAPRHPPLRRGRWPGRRGGARVYVGEPLAQIAAPRRRPPGRRRWLRRLRRRRAGRIRRAARPRQGGPHHLPYMAGPAFSAERWDLRPTWMSLVSPRQPAAAIRETPDLTLTPAPKWSWCPPVPARSGAEVVREHRGWVEWHGMCSFENPHDRFIQSPVLLTAYRPRGRSRSSSA